MSLCLVTVGTSWVGTNHISDFKVVYVSKLSESGIIIDSFAVGSASDAYAAGVAADAIGNTYVAGFLGSDGWIVSHSRSKYKRWEQFSSRGTVWESISIGPTGNVCVAGEFEGSFEGVASAGQYDLVVASYNLGGFRQWFKTGGGQAFDGARTVIGQSVGCWVAGISSAGLVVPGLAVGPGGFVVKVNNGFTNAFRSGTEAILDLAVGPGGQLLTAEQTTSSSTSNGRFARYATNGVLVWEQWVEGPEMDSGHRITVNERGDIFTAGTFQQSARFGRLGNLQLTALTPYESFVAKLTDLSLLVAPSITRQPVGLNVESGQRVELSVVASGTGPLAYEWFKDGVALGNETATNLVIAAASAADAGEYWVVVTNLAGRVVSDRAKLMVVASPPPDIPVEVSTIAGSGEAGFLDSLLPVTAKFNEPTGVAVDREGRVFVADSSNHRVRFVTAAGVVGTLAGGEASGYLEGRGSDALFRSPMGLALEGVGDLVVSDFQDHRIRKILAVGYRSTTTLAGNGIPGFESGTNCFVRLNAPSDVAIAANGEIFFTETSNHLVRKINLRGCVEPVAGTGVAGFRDGETNVAQFNQPMGIEILGGDLYVADWGNNRLRKIALENGEVTTIAGSGVAGLKNGLGISANLSGPAGICAGANGDLYFTESLNNSVRRMDTNGWVSLLAGTGQSGFADGDRLQARFNRPSGIAMHPDGSLIVADTLNHRLRRIQMNGRTNEWVRTEGFLTAAFHPTLKIYGMIGERYRIESKTAVGAEGWAGIESVVIQETPQLWVDFRNEGVSQRIYRAVKE